MASDVCPTWTYGDKESYCQYDVGGENRNVADDESAITRWPFYEEYHLQKFRKELDNFRHGVTLKPATP